MRPLRSAGPWRPLHASHRRNRAGLGRVRAAPLQWHKQQLPGDLRQHVGLCGRACLYRRELRPPEGAGRVLRQRGVLWIGLLCRWRLLQQRLRGRLWELRAARQGRHVQPRHRSADARTSHLPRRRRMRRCLRRSASGVQLSGDGDRLRPRLLQRSVEHGGLALRRDGQLRGRSTSGVRPRLRGRSLRCGDRTCGWLRVDGRCLGRHARRAHGLRVPKAQVRVSTRTVSRTGGVSGPRRTNEGAHVTLLNGRHRRSHESLEACRRSSPADVRGRHVCKRDGLSWRPGRGAGTLTQ
jgi:hypothetical protein